MMLFNRWKNLMKRMALSENKETYDALIHAYSEDSRRYHNLSHLTSVLTLLDLCEQSALHRNELELALWFHDAVYKPLCTSNEYESAEWAREFLSQNHVNEESIKLVIQLIYATEHSAKSEQGDALLIADIDIAILGQSHDVYEKYARDVRYEYRKVPSFIYKKKRKALLESFLSKPNIFSTAHFYQAFEIQARKNLTNEIRRL